MREIELTSQFKKDYKRIKKNPNYTNLDLIFSEVIMILRKDETLALNFQTHKLKGKYSQFEECLLKPDLLLIYWKIGTKLRLIRLGSHSELFK